MSKRTFEDFNKILHTNLQKVGEVGSLYSLCDEFWKMFPDYERDAIILSDAEFLNKYKDAYKQFDKRHLKPRYSKCE